MQNITLPIQYEQAIFENRDSILNDLFFPSPITTKGKRKGQDRPSAAFSFNAFRQHLNEKLEIKEKSRSEKEKRQQERLYRAAQKKKAALEKKRSKLDNRNDNVATTSSAKRKAAEKTRKESYKKRLERAPR